MPRDKVAVIQVPWYRIVCDAEPGFEAHKHSELEYDFATSGHRARDFYGDPYARGAYTPGDFNSDDFDITDFNTNAALNGP